MYVTAALAVDPSDLGRDQPRIRVAALLPSTVTLEHCQMHWQVRFSQCGIVLLVLGEKLHELRVGVTRWTAQRGGGRPVCTPGQRSCPFSGHACSSSGDAACVSSNYLNGSRVSDDTSEVAKLPYDSHGPRLLLRRPLLLN